MNRVNRRPTTDGWMNIWMPRDEAHDVARVTRAMRRIVTSRFSCFSYGTSAASVRTSRSASRAVATSKSSSRH